MQTDPTGYWTFFCNPAKWAIDRFLATNTEQDDYMVTTWQGDYFRAGQLGVIRVGHDKRKRQQLGPSGRLTRGIYAVVQIEGPARPSTHGEDPFWLEAPKGHDRLSVPIKYVRNLLANPLSLDALAKDPAVNDKWLIRGFQSASMPLQSSTFRRILALAEIGPAAIESVQLDPARTQTDIVKLEKRYQNATPEIREAISRRIERGSLARRIKAVTRYQCLICRALGADPLGFKMKNGKRYVEVHHMIPVSLRTPGSLGVKNLITVCANHHRQLHFGDCELTSTTTARFTFRIDDREVQVRRLRTATSLT